MLLEKVDKLIEDAIDAMKLNYSEEFPLADLKYLIIRLEITGENIGDDVLDRIFSKFCVGSNYAKINTEWENGKCFVEQ